MTLDEICRQLAASRATPRAAVAEAVARAQALVSDVPRPRALARKRLLPGGSERKCRRCCGAGALRALD
jgi:hypothetical protein